ncbi:MAG: hypothetical protein J6V72_03790 [Kiritimatiellae bacterium]|nr:hypothetical protein [Kiritimatiellia bacterium]
MAKSEKKLTRSEKLLNRARMLINRSEAERKQRCPLMQAACATEAIATLLLMLVEREETGEREEE